MISKPCGLCVFFRGLAKQLKGGGGRKWEGAQQNWPQIDVTPASLLLDISNLLSAGDVGVGRLGDALGQAMLATNSRCQASWHGGPLACLV